MPSESDFAPVWWAAATQARLSNDDGDGNENGKKAIGFDQWNNNFARASRFFVHSFAFKTKTWKCLISCFVENVNTRQQLSFSFPELRYSLLEFISRKICQHLTNWTGSNRRDKVWSSANSLFMWLFRSCHRRCCVSSLVLKRNFVFVSCIRKRYNISLYRWDFKGRL